MNPFGRRVLFVGASPGAVERNAGGTIHRLTQNSVEVRTLSYSSNQEEEFFLAHKYLGVRETHTVPLDRFNLLTESAAALRKLIQELNPDTVVTHNPNDLGDRARTIYRTVELATESVANLFVFKPRFLLPNYGETCAHTFVSKLTLEDIDAKIKACIEVSQRSDYEFIRIGGYYGYAETFEIHRLVV